MAEIDLVETDPVESALQTLIDLGQKRKYLTWEEMNEILPDDAINPDSLEMIMLKLERHKIEMVDESEAERLGLRYQTRIKQSSDEDEPEEEPEITDLP